MILRANKHLQDTCKKKWNRVKEFELLSIIRFPQNIQFNVSTAVSQKATTGSATIRINFEVDIVFHFRCFVSLWFMSISEYIFRHYKSCIKVILFQIEEILIKNPWHLFDLAETCYTNSALRYGSEDFGFFAWDLEAYLKKCNSYFPQKLTES